MKRLLAIMLVRHFCFGDGAWGARMDAWGFSAGALPLALRCLSTFLPYSVWPSRYFKERLRRLFLPAGVFGIR